MSNSGKQSKEYEFKCSSCGAQWSNGAVTCPICKTEITEKQVSKKVSKPRQKNTNGKDKEKWALNTSRNFTEPEFFVVGRLTGYTKSCSADNLISAMRDVYSRHEDFYVYHRGERVQITYSN